VELFIYNISIKNLRFSKSIHVVISAFNMTIDNNIKNFSCEKKLHPSEKESVASTFASVKMALKQFNPKAKNK
jgi:hypothetical protein